LSRCRSPSSAPPCHDHFTMERDRRPRGFAGSARRTLGHNIARPLLPKLRTGLAGCGACAPQNKFNIQLGAGAAGRAFDRMSQSKSGLTSVPLWPQTWQVNSAPDRTAGRHPAIDRR
jgi:hypothetical protein